MHVTKHALGESYITATGLLLGLVLLGHLSRVGSTGLLWAGAALLPIVVLLASAYWIDRLGLGGEEVWRVANYSAAALGVAAVGATLLSAVQSPVPSVMDTALLVTILAAATTTGVLVGVVRELQQSNRRLGLRNAVLHRVLRHNLRNDMTVVLCLLDDLEAEADDGQRETVDHIRRKVETLVDLTDKVRQVNLTVDGRGEPTDTVDLAALIECRVERLAAEFPSVSIDTELPGRALARTNGEFELVLDNVVQSAVRRGDDPELRVVLTTDGGTVTLRIEDHSGAIPEADISAVASGAETELEHGLGMELWLVYWLVDASGGDIGVETEDGVNCIDIELERAADSRLAFYPR
jgi:two-component system OmpR family sensor kinase